VKLLFLLFFVGMLASVYLVVAVSPQGGEVQSIAWAQTGSIEVSGQGAESKFPDGVRFFLTAQSPDEINDIRVFFKKLGNTTSSTYRSVEFQPGNSITGEAMLRAGTGTNYIPPGTMLEYSFEIRDKAGRVQRTPDQTFIYQDSRFEWRTVSEGLITVYYYGEFVENRARTVLDAAQAALERMRPVLGIEPTEPLRIVSYNNYRHMAEALPFRAQAVGEQLVTQGMAFSDERVLLVHGFDASVRGTTSHEFTHLLVHEAAGGAQVPAWLDEGLAEYGNIDPTDDYDAALRYGIFTRRIKPLWYQGVFGGAPDDIIIAYGQARSVVQYMIAKNGKAKMAELMRVLGETHNIDQALKQVYGFDQYGLDSEWRAALGLEALPPPEELERQLREQQQAQATPTPVPPATPAPTPGSPAKDGPDQKSSGGCNAANPHYGGGVAADLGSLFLLAGPLAAFCARAIRRSRR